MHLPGDSCTAYLNDCEFQLGLAAVQCRAIHLYNHSLLSPVIPHSTATQRARQTLSSENRSSHLAQITRAQQQSTACWKNEEKKKILIFGFMSGLEPYLPSISRRIVWILFRDPPESSMYQKTHTTSQAVLQTQDVLDEPFLPEINPRSNYSERYFILAEAGVYSSTLGFKGLAFWCRLL